MLLREWQHCKARLVPLFQVLKYFFLLRRRVNTGMWLKVRWERFVNYLANVLWEQSQLIPPEKNKTNKRTNKQTKKTSKKKNKTKQN